jgi:hypothetical protein
MGVQGATGCGFMPVFQGGACGLERCVFEIMDGVCVSVFDDKRPLPCLCWCVTRVLLRVCRAGAVMMFVDCPRWCVHMWYSFPWTR